MIKTIPVGDSPYVLEYNPSNKVIYVGNYFSYSVSVIDSTTNKVIKTIDVGDAPVDLKFNPSNGDIYVAGYSLGDITVISGSVVVTTIASPSVSFKLGYNPVNENIYVANYFNPANIKLINSATNTLIKNIDVGDFPWDIEHSPSSNRVYVSNLLSDDVSLISSSNTVVKTITVGDGPTDLMYNPSNKRMYVINSYSDDVSVIGSTIILGPAPNSPSGLMPIVIH